MNLGQIKKYSYFILALGALIVSPVQAATQQTLLDQARDCRATYYAATALSGLAAITLTKAIDCYVNKKPFSKELKQTFKLLFTNPRQLLKNGKGDQASAIFALLTGATLVGLGIDDMRGGPAKRTLQHVAEQARQAQLAEQARQAQLAELARQAAAARQETTLRQRELAAVEAAQETLEAAEKASDAARVARDTARAERGGVINETLSLESDAFLKRRKDLAAAKKGLAAARVSALATEEEV